jgi:SAM-dependent methyltransferase
MHPFAYLTPPRRKNLGSPALPALDTAIDTIAFLESDIAQAELARLDALPLREDDTLALISGLRRTFSADHSALLLQQARLRRRAAGKFPYAQRMYFVEEALEQATHHDIAAERARALALNATPGAWLDLGCGIGGDLIALAHHRPIFGYELDPLRAAFARANVAAAGTPNPVQVYQQDWVAALDGGTLPAASAAFVDPARRVKSGGASKRIFSLHAMQPPIEAIQRLAQQVPLIAVKVMPGVPDSEIPHGWSAQFVSHDGVCKEGVLWWGLQGQPRRWATVHDGIVWHRIEASGDPPPQGALTEGMNLYEPDPAVIRAGALTELCAELHAWQFDPQIAYLVGDNQTVTPSVAPFISTFEVRELHRFSLRLLNQRIAALRIGRVELKKRGFPTEPESLRSKIKLYPNGEAATIIFTRRGNDHIMLICSRKHM